MPRPCQQRTIRAALEGGFFAPCPDKPPGEAPVLLTLDGLEAIRLVDVEGLYQEAAAERMGVSRATFARVLTAARRGVADALVHGRPLEIGGGAVRRGREREEPCPVHGGPRRRGRGCRCRGRRRGGGRGRCARPTTQEGDAVEA